MEIKKINIIMMRVVMALSFIASALYSVLSLLSIFLLWSITYIGRGDMEIISAETCLLYGVTALVFVLGGFKMYDIIKWYKNERKK